MEIIGVMIMSYFVYKFAYACKTYPTQTVEQ